MNDQLGDPVQPALVFAAAHPAPLWAPKFTDQKHTHPYLSQVITAEDCT